MMMIIIERKVSEIYQINIIIMREDLLVNRRQTARKDPIFNRKNKHFTHAVETPVVCASIQKSSQEIAFHFDPMNCLLYSTATLRLGQFNMRKKILLSSFSVNLRHFCKIEREIYK
jgi:hypothetical protein